MMRAVTATRSVVSSMTMTPPEPAMVRRILPPPMSKLMPGRTCTGLMRSSVMSASNSIGMSSSLASSGGIDEPPGMTALTFLPPGTPPHTLSMTSRSGMPIGSS